MFKQHGPAPAPVPAADLAAALAPFGHSRMLPRAAYVDPAVFEWEQRNIFSGWTYSLPAAVLVLAVVFYPLSMLAAEVSMRRIDGRLEEAALMVASPRRVLSRITLPLAAPGPGGFFSRNS